MGKAKAGQAVVVEVQRHGRRPRYHRGSRIGRDVTLVSEQCNTDQAGQGRQVLAKLPALPRPWTQLCRRCWARTPELSQALAYQADRAARAAAGGNA